MECLHCGKKLGVVRKLQKDEFCSVAHRKAYAKKQNDDALDYLLKSKPILRPAVQPAPVAESAAPLPVEPKPLLVLAQSVEEHVAPEAVSALPKRNTQPLEQKLAVILPAGAHHAGPQLLTARPASEAVLAHASPPDGCKSTPKSAAPFEAVRPRVRVTFVHPIWIGAHRPVETKRPRAGFVTTRPTWIDLASHPVRAGATAIGFSPAVARVDLAPHRPSFRLAAAQLSVPQASTSPGQAIERNGTAWQNV